LATDSFGAAGNAEREIEGVGTGRVAESITTRFGAWRKAIDLGIVETTVTVLRERKRCGGDPGYAYKKRRSQDFPGSHGLTRRRVTATSPADIPPCGQPYQIWKDA